MLQVEWDVQRNEFDGERAGSVFWATHRARRQLLVSLDNLGNKSSTETWTRLEDGNVTGQVTLNSTFGTDEYPAVVLTYTSEYDEGDSYTK